MWLSQIKGHSYIANPRMAALSHRKPTAFGAFRDNCGAQNSEKKRAVATCDKTNEALNMLHVCLNQDGHKL